MDKMYLGEIYSRFLSSISDYTILERLEWGNRDEVEEDLYEYFLKAKARFYKCKSNLDTLEDSNGKYFGVHEYITHRVGKDETLEDIINKYNTTSENVSVGGEPINPLEQLEKGKLLNIKAIRSNNISEFELLIIVNLMLVEYLKTITLSTEVLKQSLSDKDFRIYSQANQLRELNLLYRLFQRESNKMLTEYTYIGMTDND